MYQNLPTHVTLSNKVLFRQVADEGVLLALEGGLYYGLSELGARIWQLLSQQSNLSIVRNTLLEEYDVDEPQLNQDLAEFVTHLAEVGLVRFESD
jgi:hypothetical protein